MLKSKASIKAKFNQNFSSHYCLWETLSYPLRAKLIGKHPEYKGKKILDVCCGTGVNSLILAKKGAKVTGIDLSVNQIALAKKKKAEK